MRQNSQLSAVLHAILHIARSPDPMPSDALATCMQTNPVVVRRTMAGLRDAGIVTSARGHGGGWTLARPLDQATLLDVHRALGSPSLLAFGLGGDPPACLLARAVHGALESERQAVEERLFSRMAAITLADLTKDFDRHMAGSRKAH